MAKQQIRQYVFTPGAAGAGTIEIPGKWDLNQITLITNVTRNTILYNFADTTYLNTTVTFNRGNTANFPTVAMMEDGTTTITLGVSTTGYSSTDNLQIFIERLETITRPWPMGTDAFERTRVAAPSSMIDSDFEYGMQPTKWQTISLVRGAPSVYEVPGTDQTITSITTDASNAQGANVESLITVTTGNPHLLTQGTPLTVQNLDNTVNGYSRAQGIFVVNSVTNSTVFNYYAKAQVGTTSSQSINTSYTVVRKGGFYTNSSQTPTYNVTGSGATTTGTITLTFATNHGFVPGDSIFSAVSSDNGTNNHTLVQGPFLITSVPSLTTLTFSARNVGTITGTPVGIIYPRPDSFYEHRPADGGVMLGAGGPNYGSHAIRQSKKYIRYQSGKAVNYNTGAQFAPSYNLQAVTATNTTIGSTVYVTTDDLDHGLQAGSTIMLNGIVGATGFSGTYTVASIVSERQFAFTATQVLSTTTPYLTDPATMNHVNWIGATIRAGTFDDQNGMYWQYDGQQMAVGRRASTFQIAGQATAVPGSNLITGVNSRYDTQLTAGDRVVLKGMSHVVTSVSSSTWIYVNPPYRGSTTTSGAKLSKTVEINVPQSMWNMDRCDGSNGPFNPSGYNLLPWKMQMIGLQWTWYGAGFIDWMLRGPQGNYITVHRMKNSNVNYEAYQRSGNMPVRYEVVNEGYHTPLAQPMGTTDTVMTVTDITFFASTGTVYVDNEIISYTGKVASTTTTVIDYLGRPTMPGTLTGLTRSAPLTYFYTGAQRSLTAGSAAVHNSGTGVVSVGVTATPSLSHWGSAFMTDGGFNDDVGYIFNYNAINVNISTIKQTAFAIRLAPSVSNAVTGDLGVRELVNRAQMKLQTLEITAGGSTNVNSAMVIEGVINPSNFPTTVTNITWYNLQGTIAAGNPLGSGQPSFAQVSPAGYVNYSNTATYTTTVNNGGNSVNSGTYAIPVASTASITIGDAVTAITGGGTSLTAGNSIVTQTSGTWIILNNATINNIQDGNTLRFYRNTWAQPGETIFSFISSPANKDSIDLTGLKELTNTPLGGRGTYPNGPDTLFINVYLTQGSPINAQLVLRWAEPQA